MRTLMKIEDTDKVNVTMTITMPAAEWRDLDAQLQARWPATRLSGAIRDCLRQLEKTALSNGEEEL